MTLYPGADASETNAPLPSGTKIVAGYIGWARAPGAPDTPHIWTPAEWNQYLDPASDRYAGDGIRCLPIYTHDYAGVPEQDAANAADAAIALGWSHDRSRIIAWDAEFLADNAYAFRLQTELHKRGFMLMTYEQTPLQDPAADFRWIFRWQAPFGPPPRSLPAGWDGWQYSGQSPWDLDVFSQAVYDRCGYGMRRT